MRALRPDQARFRALLQERQFRSLWHFTRLASVPCILFHGTIYSIQQLEARGLYVPARESRQADIDKGVGDYVKISTMPYWDMLSRLLRDGKPHVFIEFTTDPVLFEDTRFGDRNVWDNGWQNGDTFEFARDNVLVRRNKRDWVASSPPEIYVRTELPINPYARRILTYTREDYNLVNECLRRLAIQGDRMMVIHGPSYPFPDSCHAAHLSARGPQAGRLQTYFNTLTINSLRRGVEIDDD
jgi:hypothetical protein